MAHGVYALTQHQLHSNTQISLQYSLQNERKAFSKLDKISLFFVKVQEVSVINRIILVKCNVWVETVAVELH